MSAFLRAPFAEIAPHLEATGYQPVPIKPGFKAPMLDDWQAGHPAEYYLPRCARWGTGLLTATCPAIDLDIRDKELVRALIRVADDMIAPAPFRIGSPPKALLPFSTDTPFDKLSGRWLALPGDDWRADGYVPHRIEILGAGQQFLAYARRPRGTFYRWRRGEPMQSYWVDLPEIDQGRAQAFLWAAQSIIREAGATALVRRDKVWFPDPWARGDFGEPEQQQIGAADAAQASASTPAGSVSSRRPWPSALMPRTPGRSRPAAGSPPARRTLPAKDQRTALSPSPRALAAVASCTASAGVPS